MNRLYFHDIVKGKYGRKIAYANVESINEENILKVVSNCIGIFNSNKTVIKYLWDYKNGDQPILYRKKRIRDDIVNKVVENHAWEIVQFKNAQTNGEPIMCVSLKKDDRINEMVDKLNNYLRVANKHVKDIDCGEWTSAVGTGFKAIQRTGKTEKPLRFIVPTPMNTFVIYSKLTEEPVLAVQELKDKDEELYYLCFSETHEYKIKNGSLVSFDNEIKSRPHAFGGIPIVEYPNNQSRISDIELVITMLDAINTMQSNRMDGIEQFIQAWVKFVNCEVDEENFRAMKMLGALVVKSNNGDGNKADVDVMSQELDQAQSQIAKNDLWNNILSISAIPNKEGNTGGDTQGAVELRNGWDFSKQRAKLKDPYIIQAERQLMEVALNIVRIQNGANDCPLSMLDFDIQISHSPTDNLQVKSQVLQILLNAGIHPVVAIKVCGLWNDPEKVYLMSKPYLDVLYKTIDEVIKEQGLEKQLAEAQNIINQLNNTQKQEIINK